MKRITNILSYLWLLLLMAVTACSDLEEIVINMQGEEEVELTIQTNIPSLGGSTRTAPTENITSITALAFDSDYELVKVVKATLDRDETNGENNSTVGTMTIKVPVRTRRIHFIAQNDDEFSRITDADYGRTDIDLLKTLASDELHYWQVVNFANKTNLQSFNNGAELELIRNQARVYLTFQDASMTGHIVGFLNYNTTGTIAASKNEEFGYVATGDNHEMPSTFLVASDSDPDANLGIEHYLFEEKNTKGADGFGEAADLVYVVCWIKKGNEDGKYYKIAFKSGESYYHIIRNLEYEIKISKDLDTTRGYANFADAVAKAPINDADAKVQIHMNFNPDPLSLLLGGDPGTTTITGFEGITVLQIGYPEAYFAQGGVAITGIEPTEQTEVTTEGGNNIWVDTYSITDQTSLELTATLLSTIQDAHKDIQIQFKGEGSEVFVDDILHANALQRGDLTITTSATKIPKVAGSQFTASVPVQSYAQDVGGYRLFIDDAKEAFTVTLPDGVRTLADGSYEVTNLAGSQAVFTFTLNKDGEAGDEHEISFDLYTDFHHLIGSTTVTLVEEQIEVRVEAEPSATSLYYANSSVEDLWVNVTIPKEVNKLTFASEHFAVMVAGSQGEYVDSGDGYAINHAENATETIVPFRIRLNDDVSGEARFTFGGESDKQNVTVQSASGNITLNNNGDANVRWQGNVPLNGNNYDAIVPLKYEWFESIAAGSKLNLEFTVTGGDASWLEVFEIQGETSYDWTAYSFGELNDGSRYAATENGNVSLSLTLTDAILDAIKEYFRSDFLGEKKIAFAIRGEGITLTKVSVGEVETVALSAVPYVTSLDYSENSVSDLIVNVTIPAGVTTLNFESEYFDLISVNGRTKTENEVSTPYISVSNDGYSVNHQGESSLTLPFRLRLKSEKKAPTSSAGYTFGGSGEGVTVTPATISNITLTESGDEYVRWQGDVLLNWGNEGAVTQIPLPYSWFEGLSPGSTLRVDYEVTDAEKSEDNRDAVIQFTEVKGESWTDNSYFFEELRASDNNDMGLNLSKLSATNIYSKNYVELYLTQTILSQMSDNQTAFDGMENIVMAIQGGNVRLKKISVIPNNQADNGQLDINLDFYADINGNSQIVNRDNNVYEDLLLGTSCFYLKATISKEDATKYAGQSVTLVNTFSGNGYQYANSNGAIHWDNSSIDNNSNINSNGDATQLSFTVDANTTEYVIEWVFQTGSYYKGGDIGFAYSISTYTISDVSYNNIDGDKSATIAFTDEPIYLDVYSDADTDDGNDISIVSDSQLVMKATLSSDIAPGTQITFDLSNSTGDGINNITWNENNSASSAKMSWPNITLTVVQGQSDYYLYWYPVGNSSATLNFTVNDYDLNSVGNSSYSKTITVSGTEFLDSPHKFTTEQNGNWTSLTFDGPFPIGTKIILTFSEGGGIKLCDGSNNNLYVPAFASKNLYGNGGNSDLWMTAPTGNLVLDITEDIILYGKGTGTNNGSLSANNPLNRLIIESGATVLDKVVVVYPNGAPTPTETVIFECDFEDENMDGIQIQFQEDAQGEYIVTNGSLVLNVTTVGENWHAQVRYPMSIEQNATYKLTFKVKSTVEGNLSIYLDNTDDYQSCGGFSTITLANKTDDWTEVETTATANATFTNNGRFVINFGHLKGTIYIDDLKLVKN